MLVTLSPLVVLRGEPYYFGGHYVAFNSRTWQTVSLSRGQYECLCALGTEGAEKGLFVASLEQLKGADGSGGSDFMEKGILIPSDKGSRRFPIPPAAYEPIVEGVQCLSAPSLLELCITRRCNEACYHCNVSSRSESSLEKQPISFWTTLLEKCAEVGVFKVTITGGEPFIRQEFDLLLDRLVRLPLAASILTNGLCVSDHHIELIKEANMSLGVSLDGANAQQHDQFRRLPGAFDRTMQVMKELGRAGVCFTISVTVHSQNIGDLSKFIAIAKEVGADTLVFGPMGGVGRGATGPAKRYHAPAPELWRALEEVIALAKGRTEKPDIIVANYEEREVLEFQGGKIKSRRPPGLCKAGIYALAVDEDGLAYPCLRALQSKIHPIGDLTVNSIQEIWRSQRWSPFRDKKLTRVPCRAEAIEAMTAPEDHLLSVSL